MKNRSDRHIENLISAAAANAEVLIRRVCANVSSRPEASGFQQQAGYIKANLSLSSA